MKRALLLFAVLPVLFLATNACESAGDDVAGTNADGGPGGGGDDTPGGGDDDTTPGGGGGTGENPLPADPKVAKAFEGTFGFLDGPTWKGDELIFTDVTSQTDGKYAAFKYKEGAATPELYSALGGQTIGLALGKDGELLGAQAAGQIVKIADGASTDVVTAVGGEALNGPNDLVVRKKDGMIFFTEPAYLGSDPNAEKNRVSRAEAGKSDGVAVETVGATHPNGIALSPDESILYVSFTGGAPPVIQKYAVNADGTTGEAKPFVELPAASEPDGLAVDSAGNVYVAHKDGGGGKVTVFSPTGTKHGEIAVPEAATGLAFGGADKKTLYITANTGSSGSVYKVTLNVAGIVD